MSEIIVATPSKDGNIVAQTAQAMFYLGQACAKKGIDLHWSILWNDAYIHSARDILANRFLDDTKASHLLFLDADVVFRPDDFFELLRQDKPVIGALYPGKRIEWDMVHEAATKKKLPAEMLDHVSGLAMIYPPQNKQGTAAELFSPMEVEFLPTGFMLIRRDVLEKYREHYNDTYMNHRYLGAMKLTSFFRFGLDPNDRSLVGEDVWFCRRVTAMGIKIYVMPLMTLSHVGIHEFKGCPWCYSGHVVHRPIKSSS